VPEQPDEDGLVPPIKVMRRRLNGVYSAEGLTGPTRRYVLIVAMLVGLASLPTLAAITAGSNELNDGRPGAMDAPFLPPASTGPVRVRPTPSASTWTSGPQPDGTVPGSSGTAQGQAQKHKTKPRPGAPVTVGKGYAQSARGGLSGSSGSLNSGGSSSPSGDSAESWRPGSSSGGGSSGSGSSGSGSASVGSSSGGVAPARLPVMPVLPSVPMPRPVPVPVPAKPQRPSGSVGGGDSQDDSLNDRRDDSSDDDRWSGGDSSGSRWSGGGSSGDHWSGGGDHDGSGSGPGSGSDSGSGLGSSSGSGDGEPEPPAKPVRPSWCVDRSDCSSRPGRHHRPDRPRHQDCDDRGYAQGRRSTERDQPAETSSIRTAKAARSDSRRRPEVTERPHNVRPARPADRTHNSNRYQPSAADRGEGTQTTTATRAYRGSHRAERMHRADDHTGAHHRSSRMGRHHAAPRQDSQDHQQNRW
jgi:hypothetical protein